MLRITNHSENYDGVITIDDVDIANVNGSVTQENAYASFNSYDINAVKANATDVSSDMAEFMEALLGVSGD